MAEDHLAAPAPLEEHRRLAVFAGEWAGDEIVYPSRWNAGGPATSQVTARIGLNVVPADNLDDAAQKIVKAVKGG